MSDCAPHTACDPDTCFGAKMRYIRENGGLSVAYQGSKPGHPKGIFHDSTIPERQRLIEARARANGYEARPLNPTYDRPANFGAPRNGTL